MSKNMCSQNVHTESFVWALQNIYITHKKQVGEGAVQFVAPI